MRMSLLVACDDIGAAASAFASGADELVLDLGAPGPSDARVSRRRTALDILLLGRTRPAGGPRLVVRVAALPTGLVDDDLDAVMAGAPCAILLPCAVGAVDIQHLAAKLAVREAEWRLPAGRTGVVAAAADTARGVLALPGVSGAGPRLSALLWDPSALAADLGATDADADPSRVARSLLLTAAAAVGVPAIAVAPRGGGALLRRWQAACHRDGFAGLLASPPERDPAPP